MKSVSIIKVHLFFCAITIVFLSFYFLPLKQEIEDLKKGKSVYKRFFEKYKNEGEGAQSLATITLHEKLKQLPLAESQQLVIKTKKVIIRNVSAPYNASIIPYRTGYLIFFRYDIKDKKEYTSYIGCAELDTNFDQTSKEFIKIETLNNHSEDPRLFCIGKEAFLAYTKSEFKKDIYPPFISTVNLSSIDLDSLKLKFITQLDPCFNSIEKNWAPFEYNGQIHFQYSLNPHKILYLEDPRTNHLTVCANNALPACPWEDLSNGWGSLRGGTPALNIGNEYLAFFHSSFIGENGLIWYSMGAYTFENHPPFRITAMSPYPILFSDIYDSTSLNTAEARKRVIFPTNFVIEEKDGKELIHLSCGENDSSIKIITLDKAILLKGLKKSNETKRTFSN